MSSNDEVRLAVPAMPEYLRLARVTAAGLASRIGFSFDEVEDLRLAIDELCYGLTGHTGRPGTVEVRYRVEDDGLVIEGRGNFDVGPDDTGRTAAVGAPGSAATALHGDPDGDGDGDGTGVPAVGLSELSKVILAALVDEHEMSDAAGGPTFRLVKRRRTGPDAVDGATGNGSTRSEATGVPDGR